MVDLRGVAISWVGSGSLCIVPACGDAREDRRSATSQSWSIVDCAMKSSALWAMMLRVCKWTTMVAAQSSDVC